MKGVILPTSIMRIGAYKIMYIGNLFLSCMYIIDYVIDFPFRWNNHSMNLVTRFTGLYQSETLVDVTLAAEGKHLQVSCVAIICPIDDFSKTKYLCTFFGYYINTLK